MAILEELTNNYYKINFQECLIKGRSVYVTFYTYASPDERMKEKIRFELWAKFFQTLREYIDNIYQTLMQKIKDQKLIPENLFSKTEEEKIDKELYPDLRSLQDKYNSLSPYENKILNYLYWYGVTREELIIHNNIKDELIKLGFNEEWITKPIYINSQQQVYCGEYNDEHIDEEFYYNRLKTKLSDNIKDC